MPQVAGFKGKLVDANGDPFFTDENPGMVRNKPDDYVVLTTNDFDDPLTYTINGELRERTYSSTRALLTDLPASA